ncbi:uncharacterized protein FOMMEDRAFT_153331 [Fomitiporia mediterranea MF3/22]|uniref:uncharacterized protein n=1 Tax=Fomitiporia mediterranea (strain MF3/22) TaxID=694068 RepID=UPI0004407D65|nr:uncharacterized protein FOMMEDRAFT_153331 [Fomitiporia mediterranea MF3/22]EJD05983.1 hypothetical protein FOMMEDRAFT_153331 [Fomitiporia mediterranea MF3/22]
MPLQGTALFVHMMNRAHASWLAKTSHEPTALTIPRTRVRILTANLPHARHNGSDKIQFPSPQGHSMLREL